MAIFDADGDGRLDLYFATCNTFPLEHAPNGAEPALQEPRRRPVQDVTDASGLGFAGFCHGIIAGDIDNDGDPDVFLCNYGPNVLYLNEGDGTFRDISHDAGIDTAGTGPRAGPLLDYDNDGDLDIYVANYGDWNIPGCTTVCGDDGTIPLLLLPWDDQDRQAFLYRNNGDRTFTDVTDAGRTSAATTATGFGVVAADLNGDGRVDLYVANDMNPNFLFLNQGDGTFEDVTETSGAAFDERGHGPVRHGRRCRGLSTATASPSCS